MSKCSLCGAEAPSNPDRNKTIALALLWGHDFHAVAKVHGISTVRARDLLHRYCKAGNPNLYDSLKGRNVTPRIKELRIHVREFEGGLKCS